MHKTLALLVNPRAAHGRASIVGRKAREALIAAGHTVVDFSGATAAEATEKLRTTTGQLAFDAVIAVGGDGLVNLAASYAIQNGVPLGVVPAGTGNDIARGLGVSRHATRALGQIIRALRAPILAVETWDVGFVTASHDAADAPPDSPEERHYFLSVLTAGLDAAVNARANGLRFPRGTARYLVALAAQLKGLRPYDYEIKIGEKTSQRRLLLVCIANTSYFGGGLQIAPQARANSGKLQAVLVSPVSLAKFLWVFPRILWGGHLRHPAVTVVDLEQITIAPRAPNTPPAPFADGEPVSGGHLKVGIEKGALKTLKLG